jgi:GPI mannosyltransferase 1 subunit M
MNVRLMNKGCIWTASCAIGLVSSTALGYMYYGDTYINEALLHHLNRADHRHNYSMWWYPIYLTSALSAVDRNPLNLSNSFGLSSASPLSSMISYSAMIPQLAFILIISYQILQGRHGGESNGDGLLHALNNKVVPTIRVRNSVKMRSLSRLPLCYFVITAVFVHANKVLTAQYFIWYLCLLPLIYPHLEYWQHYSVSNEEHHWGIKPRVKYSVVTWLTSIVAWLACAYGLEFQGLHLFTCLWILSVAFFFTSTNLVAVLCSIYVDEPMRTKAH